MPKYQSKIIGKRFSTAAPKPPKRAYSKKTTTKKLVRLIKNVSLRQCETKENLQNSTRNQGLTHNDVLVVINPFVLGQGVADTNTGTSNRIGDQIIVKGVSIYAMFENALNRPKVFFRVMLIRAAKSDTISKSTLFKGNSNNKLIDQIDTERFKVIYSRCFNISASNTTAVTVNVDGSVATGNPAGIPTRIFKAWIPGTKISRSGKLQFLNGSSNELKFYDYRVVVLAYDWYGSDGTAPTVGRINDLYTKVYFKDP